MNRHKYKRSLIRRFWTFFVPDGIRNNVRIRSLINRIDHKEPVAAIDNKSGMLGKKYNIIDLNNDINIECIKIIKDISYEDICIPEIYEVAKETHILGYSGCMGIYRVSDAIIAQNSDVVIVERLGGIIWYREQIPVFSTERIIDKNILDYDIRDRSATIKPYSSLKQVSGSVISMLGLQDNIWSHFILQFLGKLCIAKEYGLLNKRITLVMPKYSDTHIVGIVEKITDEYNNINIIIAEADKHYSCEKLYYISPPITMLGVQMYYTPWNLVCSQITIELIKKYISSAWLSKLKEEDSNNSKIYLVRRETYRKLDNWRETEHFFQSIGYSLIEPDKMSLEEKVKVFYEAQYIVGPFSSAFSNIVFCKPHTKCMVFTNFQFTMDGMISMLAKVSDADVKFVTGSDDYINDLCTSFYVSIDRIKGALSEYGFYY